MFGFMHSRGGVLDERTAVTMVLQPTLSALAYIHGLGMIHRDVKPVGGRGRGGRPPWGVALRACARASCTHRLDLI